MSARIYRLGEQLPLPLTSEEAEELRMAELRTRIWNEIFPTPPLSPQGRIIYGIKRVPLAEQYRRAA